jgi:hypothetical protein
LPTQAQVIDILAVSDEDVDFAEGLLLTSTTLLTSPTLLTGGFEIEIDSPPFGWNLNRWGKSQWA